jgi:hypothetical protein
MLHQNFIYFGFLLNMVGTVSYIVHTLQGKTKPNRVTWFMWALAPAVALSAQLSEGVGLQALLTFAVGFGPFLIFLASFVNRKSYWKLTPFDIGCGILSFAGLVFWIATRHAEIAIIFAILADAFAALPTIVKSWRDPETESYLAFLLSGVNALITVLTIKHLTISEASFAIYILLANALLFVLIRFQLGKKFNLGQKLQT